MGARQWTKTLFAVVGVFLLMALGLFLAQKWFSRALIGSRLSATHTFPLAPPPRFLSDDAAISRARETMKLEGYDLALWEPQEDHRTTAPDGAVDRYFVRNAINPSDGFIVFVDRSGGATNPSRMVNLTFKGDRVECEVLIPK